MTGGSRSDAEDDVDVSAELRLPRDARRVRTVRAVLQVLLSRLDAPVQTIDEVSLAVTEACGNVIRHASGSSRYRIAIQVGPGCCCVDVSDRGPGFEAPTQPQPRADVTEDGRGLVLMAALTDGLAFERSSESMTVRMCKRWPLPAA
jgi:serine/threonine-protein kinase RsbW